LPDAEEEERGALQQRPAIMLLATGLGVQASQTPGSPPVIVIQLSVVQGGNLLATATMPLALDQARAHAEDVGRAILEAESVQLPDRPKLITSREAEGRP
jgi:hypothetical protein